MKKTSKEKKVSTPAKAECKKVTKSGLVKAHLLKHKSITSLEAIEKYSATRLSAIIFTLRKKGFSIVTKDVTIKDRFGNNCIYGKYVLLSTPNK